MIEKATGVTCTDCPYPVYRYTDGHRSHYGHDQAAVNTGRACPSPALADRQGNPIYRASERRPAGGVPIQEDRSNMGHVIRDASTGQSLRAATSEEVETWFANYSDLAWEMRVNGLPVTVDVRTELDADLFSD